MFRSAGALMLILAIVFLSACSREDGGMVRQSSQPRSGTRPLPPPPPSTTSPSTANSDNPIAPVIECYRDITKALAGVRDEQTARAAAPIVGQAADRLEPAMERMVAAVKTAMATGVPPAGGNADDNADAFDRMRDEIDRVYHIPAGQYIKPEIKRVLNVLVETAFAAERDRIQRWINDRKLN